MNWGATCPPRRGTSLTNILAVDYTEFIRMNLDEALINACKAKNVETWLKKL
jgi:hypothetical protein